ncbi:MAG: Mur ligase family protein [Candidatus Omnitrophota bacterium]
MILKKDLKSIHIAGTKGKGSTCVFIANILRQAQFKVGLYTSPHLSDFRERIRILNPRLADAGLIPEFEGMISKEDLTVLVEELVPIVDEFNARSEYGGLSFFEVYTALAFKYFKEKKVDFAVLETGLGGRLDATNTVNSLIAAITPISYEHTNQLGNTLTEIASEKAGIIKSHQVTRLPGHKLIVITAPQEKEALEVIKNRCKVVGARLYEVGRDIVFEVEKTGQDYKQFNITGSFGSFTNLKIHLLGNHQVINAALAVSVVLALDRACGLKVGQDAVREGLRNTVWPGRFEIVLREPLVILDGAQNIASAKVLREVIIDSFPGKRIVLVLGISRDKDIKEYVRCCCR